jgi:Flp pilus assembly protein TadG
MFRRLVQFPLDCAGAALLEFTIVLPALLLIMMGAIQFGSVVYNLNVVANATAAGIRQLSISRGEAVVASPASGPYTDAVNQVKNYFSTSDWNHSYVTITLIVNGTTCTTDTTCQTALNTAQQKTASVTVRYSAPCVMTYILQSCNLTSKLYAMVQ